MSAASPPEAIAERTGGQDKFFVLALGAGDAAITSALGCRDETLPMPQAVVGR